MRKRLFSFLLACGCCLSLLTPAALARETDYFEDLPETFDFNTLAYDAGLPAKVEALCADMLTLARQSAAEAQLLATYDELETLSSQLDTNYTLIQLLYYGNPSAYADAYTSAIANYNAAYQVQLTTMQNLLTDAVYGPALIAYIGAEDAAAFLGAAAPTDAQLALNDEATQLVTKYQDAYAQELSCTYDGKRWTLSSLITAYQDGEVSYEDYYAIYVALYGELNKLVGGLYLDLTSLRNRLAQSYGYSNYAEYAYAEVYGRDFSMEDAAVFREAVKAYVVPVWEVIYGASGYGLYGNGYTYDGVSQEALLDAAEPYMEEISSELADAFDYLRACDLIDADYSDTKLPGAFTAPLPSKEAAYIYANRNGGNDDLRTLIHEFGHFSALCYGEENSSYDILEVHSQGLEALMLSFSRQLYGQEADSQTGYALLNLLYSVITGCMYDELQAYAYTSSDLTLDGLNRKSAQLMEAYGLAPFGPQGLDYSWIDIPHTFESPMYYISYATSAIVALDIYMESQVYGLDAAADRYLAFVAASGEAEGFQALTEQTGLINPFAPGAVAGFARQLQAVLDDQLYHLPYSDVEDCWARGDITLLYLLGVMNGTSDTAFSPEGTLTRGMAVTVLHRMLGEPASSTDASAVFSDVSAGKWYADAVGWAVEAGVTNGTSDTTFSPDALVTCQEFAVMLFRCLYMPGTELPGGSAPEGTAAWAQDAMVWSAGFGIFESDEGDIAPVQDLTRAELATALVNALT